MSFKEKQEALKAAQAGKTLAGAGRSGSGVSAGGSGGGGAAGPKPPTV